MAAAVTNSVGYQSESRAKETHNYHNFVVASTVHPYYENCVYPSDPYSTTTAEEENSHFLPDNLTGVQPRRPDQSTRYCYSDQSTSTFLSRTGDIPEPIRASPDDETLPKRLASSQKRSSFRSLKRVKKIMGSGSSVVKEPNEKKVGRKATKSKPSNADCNSDNGGFESATTPKPSLGVKEKLRHSLDKISLKGPFRWSSSDKLSHNARGSKSKSKNNRRYSDSTTAFLSSQTTTERKQTPQIDEKKSRTNKSVQGVSRMVRAYPSARCESAESEIIFEHGFDTTRSHDYVNLSDDTKPLKLQTIDNSSSRRYATSNNAQNEYYPTRSSNQYHELSTLPTLQAWKHKDTATKAKGTWKMLKTTKSKQIPVKTGKTYSSDPNFQATYSEFAYSTVTQPLEEYQPVSQINESSTMEPPKLTPVSGKLLLNKDAEKTILRPTAFRPTPLSNHNSPLVFHSGDENSWRKSDNAETLSEHEASSRLEKNNSISSESNRSDSGRHSATSIPVGVTIGSSFSCSGSEGYESARIPSSTNHSAVHDHEGSGVEPLPVFSTRKLSDHTLLSNLEIRVRERQDQVENLRKDFEDNQKALRDMVKEEPNKAKNSNTLKPREKPASQIKLQRRASVHEHQIAEQQYRRLHEEQQQLHDANKEMEDRIKSMADAIDAHSRQEDAASLMQARLEENQMEMQQQRGEISVLKRQVKEKQEELNSRTNEILALKSHNCELNSHLSRRESENQSLQIQLDEENVRLATLEHHLAAASMHPITSPVDAIALTSSRSANELPVFQNRVHPSAYANEFSPSYTAFNSATPANSNSEFFPGEREELYQQLQAIEQRMALQEEASEREQRQWAEDKCKVIKYQKLLQENYVQMYKRSHALEREVKHLKTQLQRAGVSAPVCDALSGSESDEKQNLTFPMDI